MFDADNLYFGILCRDRTPSAIVATQLARDADLDVDDRVTIVLDTFFDQRNGFFFSVNPAGARADGQILNNEPAPSLEWDGIWDARTRVTGEGWVAEVALPFKTLRFRPGQTTWGSTSSGRRAPGRARPLGEPPLRRVDQQSGRGRPARGAGGPAAGERARHSPVRIRRAGRRATPRRRSASTSPRVSTPSLTASLTVSIGLCRDRGGRPPDEPDPHSGSSSRRSARSSSRARVFTTWPG